ncbi:MAG: Na/Pi cotransporter family protein [Planctomyces sp.]|nr:Na/Pi cotransporter family protein [Planctomyces sp.]
MNPLPGLLGGIGLFLLGMSLLTDGLRDFAGDSLRRGLMRFTGTPLKAFLSGMLVTLLIQSSSATTVMVIGFVSAGLLTFPQALGVVLGASVGTTGTSWIIAWIGLKVKVGLYALPLVGFGAFLRLLGQGRWPALGTALAGFGLIFVGIDTLQAGMQGMAEVFNLARLPVRGVLGGAAAVLIGMVMTVVMQSSSVAVAMTLTAMDAGAVSFEQATLLVIGAAIGTTVTGALAAIGASVPAKRTAVAHILFNLSAGAMAVLLLPLFLRAIASAQDRFGWTEGATSLAAFHTAFIGLGAVVFLPLVNRFASTVERLIPEERPQITRHLDRTLKSTPAVALEATLRALRDTALGLFAALRTGLVIGNWRSSTVELEQALAEIEAFLESLRANPEDDTLTRHRLEQMHAIDHLLRLLSRARPSPSIRSVLTSARLTGSAVACRTLIEMGEAILQQRAEAGAQSRMRTGAKDLAQARRNLRTDVISDSATGRLAPSEALRLMDGSRWLERVAHHAWRATEYLGGDPPEPDPEDQDAVGEDSVEGWALAASANAGGAGASEDEVGSKPSDPDAAGASGAATQSPS